MQHVARNALEPGVQLIASKRDRHKRGWHKSTIIPVYVAMSVETYASVKLQRLIYFSICGMFRHCTHDWKRDDFMQHQFQTYLASHIGSMTPLRRPRKSPTHHLMH